MAETISLVEIKEAISKLEHPEIAATFSKLGMIGDVITQGDGIEIEIRVPFPNIPIKDYLAGMINTAVKELYPEIPITFNFTVMSEDIRSRFLSKARENWKGEI
jgi:metal-sulfur cluster biosynthetic enzyme